MSNHVEVGGTIFLYVSQKIYSEHIANCPPYPCVCKYTCGDVALFFWSYIYKYSLTHSRLHQHTHTHTHTHTPRPALPGGGAVPTKTSTTTRKRMTTTTRPSEACTTTKQATPPVRPLPPPGVGAVSLRLPLGVAVMEVGVWPHVRGLSPPLPRRRIEIWVWVVASTTRGATATAAEGVAQRGMGERRLVVVVLVGA
jgi:hypothetical protein